MKTLGWGSYGDAGTDTVGNMKLPYSVVRVSWLGFIALHCLCLVYFATMAICYWTLPGTMLDGYLSFYSIGLTPLSGGYGRAIAIVHGWLAGVHLVYLLWMLGWSLKKRRLVLAVYDVVTRTKMDERADKRWKLFIFGAYRAGHAKCGLLSVNGPYFDWVLLSREIVETSLQTQQAYKMSLLIPRTQLNRGYVALLVLNCWSTALIHSAFHKDTAVRRFIAIACDCVLDLVSSVGITTAVLLIYAADYDFEKRGFPDLNWYKDVWVVHAINELKVLLVTSWGDLAMRVVFALSMIANLNNMKKLLARSDENCAVTSVMPLHPSLTDSNVVRVQSRLHFVIAKESRLTKVLFFTWGFAILVLHFYAESIPALVQCKMQVKPWFSSTPSCSLLVLDCYTSKLSGTESEISAQWSPLDPTTTDYIAIRHCPSVEMPTKFTEFSQLKVLKFYNSTIVNWNASAGISQAHHSNLLMLYLVRVNMTNGQLPAGVYHQNLPQRLRDIEFCVTNLHSLPDELAVTWPKSAAIYLEASAFTEIPPPLVRLKPVDLSLALNPISTIPASILEDKEGYLHIGGTLISELPQVVNNVIPDFKLRVDTTNVSFFWNWTDSMVANAIGEYANGFPSIIASNTPYCTDLQRIYSGEQTRFSSRMRQGQSLSLSNASVGNWPTLQKTVSCDVWPATNYPIEFEDKYSGIKLD